MSSAASSASSRSPPGIHNQVRQVCQICLCTLRVSSGTSGTCRIIDNPQSKIPLVVIRLRANVASPLWKDFPLSEPTSKLPGTRFNLAGGYAAKLLAWTLARSGGAWQAWLQRKVRHARCDRCSAMCAIEAFASSGG